MAPVLGDPPGAVGGAEDAATDRGDGVAVTVNGGQRGQCHHGVVDVGEDAAQDRKGGRQRRMEAEALERIVVEGCGQPGLEVVSDQTVGVSDCFADHGGDGRRGWACGEHHGGIGEERGTCGGQGSGVGDRGIDGCGERACLGVVGERDGRSERSGRGAVAVGGDAGLEPGCPIAPVLDCGEHGSPRGSQTGGPSDDCVAEKNRRLPPRSGPGAGGLEGELGFGEGAPCRTLEAVPAPVLGPVHPVRIGVVVSGAAWGGRDVGPSQGVADGDADEHADGPVVGEDACGVAVSEGEEASSAEAEDGVVSDGGLEIVECGHDESFG